MASASLNSKIGLTETRLQMRSYLVKTSLIFFSLSPNHFDVVGF